MKPSTGKRRRAGAIKRQYLKESARSLRLALRQLDGLFGLRTGQAWVRKSDGFRFLIVQIDYDLTHIETSMPLIKLRFDTDEFNMHETKFYYELLAQFKRGK